jgi:single-stranded DNA-binding protein
VIAALISGSLYRAPEQRIAKSGRPFVTAKVKVRDGESLLFVRATAFSESVGAELLRLQDGDAVAVQGPLRIETYVGADSTTKISLSVTAENVLGLRQAPKKRAAKTSAAPDTRTKQERQRGTWTGPEDGPCDDIPY